MHILIHTYKCSIHPSCRKKKFFATDKSHYRKNGNQIAELWSLVPVDIPTEQYYT